MAPVSQECECHPLLVETWCCAGSRVCQAGKELPSLVCHRFGVRTGGTTRRGHPCSPTSPYLCSSCESHSRGDSRGEPQCLRGFPLCLLGVPVSPHHWPPWPPPMQLLQDSHDHPMPRVLAELRDLCPSVCAVSSDQSSALCFFSLFHFPSFVQKAAALEGTACTCEKRGHISSHLPGHPILAFAGTFPSHLSLGKNMEPAGAINFLQMRLPAQGDVQEHSQQTDLGKPK